MQWEYAHPAYILESTIAFLSSSLDKTIPSLGKNITLPKSWTRRKVETICFSREKLL